jgi:type II secretory pathway pseudopilin PulG
LPSLPAQPTSGRRGFSLLLSLVVLSIMLLSVIMVAAFLSVESRLATQAQLALRARLNGIVAMKLALAHTQQEAGPDRRATARADVAQPDVAAGNLLNPMWTGVWNSQRPNQPPHWLVSGRDDLDAGAQMVSLSGESDYPASAWAPWQKDYTPTAINLIPLVATGSAGPAETDKPSGLVTLPRLTLPDDAFGKYAYWVGDEGVKARFNLFDTRTTGTVNTLGNLLAQRNPVTPGLALLTGFESYTADDGLARSQTFDDLRNLTGFSEGLDSTRNSNRLFHDLTASSTGVLADSYNGGLKRDLSLAFELPDAAFNLTEFGAGQTGAAATGTANGVEPIAMRIPLDGASAFATPVFNRTTLEGEVRGPTWWALRDFHRLYKQVGWDSAGTPTLKARTFYPNASRQMPPTANADPNNVRQSTYSYALTYNADHATLNPQAMDYGNFWNLGTKPVPRPVNVAATPYIHRVMMVFSINLETFPNGGAAIYFNLTPIVVVHNPYNVAMKFEARNGAAGLYALAVSFTNWDQWIFRYRRYAAYGTGPTSTYEIPLSQFFQLQDNAQANAEDMFRVYLPDFTLKPGEFRVLSCSSPVMQDWKHVVELGNSFNQSGGFNDTLDNWGFGPESNWYYDDAFGFEVLPAGDFRVRQALACWPGDIINKTASTANFYNRSSEHTELFYRDLNPTRVGAAGEKFFPNYTWIAPKYDRRGSALPPSVITVMDLAVKTADWAGSPYPAFTHSNPMAASCRADGAGRTDLGDGNGFVGASPSHRMRLFRPSTWSEILQTSNGLAYGGYSLTSSGTQVAVQTEIPLAPPTNLAQYAHANLSMRDQQPLFGIGSSFAYTQVGAQRTTQLNSPNWTDYDNAYLLNHAAWDQYFLSGAAPEMTRATLPADPTPSDPFANPNTNSNGNGNGNGNADPTETRSLAQVLDDFVAGVKPLNNPRMRLLGEFHGGPDLRAAVGDYRRSASVLLHDGTFNVNSTSVEAWTAVLGSAKAMAAAQYGVNQPVDSAGKPTNARFPRAIPQGTSGIASGTMTNRANWTGFINLTDDQVRNLAKAIVEENKARFKFLVRTEREQAYPPAARVFRGQMSATTPYLGLTEFVNRFLNPSPLVNRCGALQSAIFRADKYFASGSSTADHFSDRLSNKGLIGKVDVPALSTNTAGPFANPENIELPDPSGANVAHAALGAPGNLLQSDLLEVIGGALATRSDTFTIRAYGEAWNTSGDSAKCWIEAVIQRVPEYMDPINAPETGAAAAKLTASTQPGTVTTSDATTSTQLTALNNVLGRRFRVVSFRTLRPHEI